MRFSCQWKVCVVLVAVFLAMTAVSSTPVSRRGDPESVGMGNLKTRTPDDSTVVNKYESLRKASRAFLMEATANKKALSGILSLVVDVTIYSNALRNRIADVDFEKIGVELENRLKEMKLDNLPTFLDIEKVGAEFNAAATKAKEVLDKSKVAPTTKDSLRTIVTGQESLVTGELSKERTYRSELQRLKGSLGIYSMSTSDHGSNSLKEMKAKYEAKEGEILKLDGTFAEIAKRSKDLVVEATQKLEVGDSSSADRNTS